MKQLLNNNLQIELYENDNKQYVFISTENSSGAKYKVDSINEIGNLVSEYINNYLTKRT